MAAGSHSLGFDSNLHLGLSAKTNKTAIKKAEEIAKSHLNDFRTMIDSNIDGD